MEIPQSSTDLRIVAADWVARVDRGPLNDSEREALEAWLSEDPRHRGAYARAEAALVVAGHAIGIDGSPHFADRSFLRKYLSRRAAIWLSGGAAVAATIAITVNISSTARPASYQTKRGGMQVVPLADGSIITLNTDTEVAVRLTRATREVHLLRGEALFDVARDPNRPFIVTAASAVVRAVGTSFAVRDLGNRPVEVLVAEGAVDMFREHSSQIAPLRVSANSRAVAVDVPVPSVRLVATSLDPAEIARQLAWRRGMIAFEGERLKDAIVEFSRYSDTRIVIDDPTIGELTVTGFFSAYHPVDFARSVAVGLNLHIEITPTAVMLWR